MTQKPLSTVDDRPLWDLHLSGLFLPSISVALELGIFDALAESSASATELAERKKLNPRAMRALLPMLVSSQLLLQRGGRYHLSEVASVFLVRGRPQYWGPVFEGLMVTTQHAREGLLAALKRSGSNSNITLQSDGLPDASWAENPQIVRGCIDYLHANALTAARIAAERLDLSGAKRLMDVGSGSGCFAVAFASANPALRCTLMDFKALSDMAMAFAVRAGVADQIETAVVDMFRQPWPRGHDVLFLSNILHDWNSEICALLLAKAFDALEAGGRILLHEALLDDTHDGPATVAALSLNMLLVPNGQQYTTAELTEMLGTAGFHDVQVTPSHAYHAIVSATKR